SAENWPARLVLAKSADIDFHCGDLLRESLAAHGLRGGGSANLAQTDVPKDLLETVKEDLEARVRTRCSEPQSVPSLRS
ncbi:MAG TPA: hypothetical protein VMA71_05075, partial [Alloacidobacterium sp.]|nr:hypothetical protein [Alloacidobacterium sp.]